MHKNKDFGFIPLSASKGLQFSDLTCNTTLSTEQTRDKHIPKYYTPLRFLYIYTYIFSCFVVEAQALLYCFAESHVSGLWSYFYSEKSTFWLFNFMTTIKKKSSLTCCVWEAYDWSGGRALDFSPHRSLLNTDLVSTAVFMSIIGPFPIYPIEILWQNVSESLGQSLIG